MYIDINSDADRGSLQVLFTRTPRHPDSRSTGNALGEPAHPSHSPAPTSTSSLSITPPSVATSRGVAATQSARLGSMASGSTHARIGRSPVANAIRVRCLHHSRPSSVSRLCCASGHSQVALERRRGTRRRPGTGRWRCTPARRLRGRSCTRSARGRRAVPGRCLQLGWIRSAPWLLDTRQPRSGVPPLGRSFESYVPRNGPVSTYRYSSNWSNDPCTSINYSAVSARITMFFSETVPDLPADQRTAMLTR